MNRIVFIIILFAQINHSQDLHSPQNRKLFADHLFCTQDYLRAVFEYEEYLKYYDNDTVLFKAALGYSKLENYREALERFNKLPGQSEFYYSSRLEFLKSKILSGEYISALENKSNDLTVNELKLMSLSNLLSKDNFLNKDKILIPFSDDEKNEILDLYNRKTDPPYKSPVIAGVLSTLIPGSGKIYSGQISEGITSFIINSLFAFLSYNNFKNHHNFRGWIFAGAGAFFYAGNIYGSAAAAQLYNAGIDYESNQNIKQFLELKNYYIDEYDFCD